MRYLFSVVAPVPWLDIDGSVLNAALFDERFELGAFPLQTQLRGTPHALCKSRSNIFIESLLWIRINCVYTYLEKFLHFAGMASHCICICIVGERLITMHFRLLFAQLQNLLCHGDVVSRGIQLPATSPQSPCLLPQISDTY